MSQLTGEIVCQIFVCPQAEKEGSSPQDRFRAFLAQKNSDKFVILCRERTPDGQWLYSETYADWSEVTDLSTLTVKAFHIANSQQRLAFDKSHRDLHFTTTAVSVRVAYGSPDLEHRRKIRDVLVHTAGAYWSLDDAADTDRPTVFVIDIDYVTNKNQILPFRFV